MTEVRKSRSRYPLALEQKKKNQTEKKNEALKKDVLQHNSNKYKLKS